MARAISARRLPAAEERDRGLTGLAPGADEVLALGRLDAAQVGDGAAELGGERLGRLGGHAVLERGLDGRARHLLREVGLADGEAVDDEREPPRRAVRVDGAVGEAELGEALLGELGQGAEGALDERGRQLLDADLEQEVARFGGHEARKLPQKRAARQPR